MFCYHKIKFNETGYPEKKKDQSDSNLKHCTMLGLFDSVSKYCAYSIALRPGNANHCFIAL